MPSFIHKLTEALADSAKRRRHSRPAGERAGTGVSAQDVFLATMSHEVRTPLNGIVGFSDLLLDTELTAEQREYVLAIHTSGEALMQLTGDILDYARIGSRRIQLRPEPCELRAVIEEAIDIVAPRAAGKKIELLHDTAPSVPAYVIADRGRLRQVLVNLLGNAIKFTPAGEVEVTLRPAAPLDAAAAREKTPVFEFSVRDTGIGISKEDQARLFKPFVQLDSSSARRYGGAGLGLAISHDLVLLMGGSFSVTSERGKGSTFSFTVPCAETKGDRAETGETSDGRLAGKRVAVVTRRDGLRREIEHKLADQGAQTLAIEMEKLETTPWDLAVVDCDETTLAHLHGYLTVPDHWRGDCVVGLIDVGMDNRQRQVLRPYFRALVTKPVHHDLLVGKLARDQGDLNASADSAVL